MTMTSKTKQKPIQIKGADVQQLVKLLGEYQGMLEEGIDCELLSNGEPGDAAAAARVEDQRGQWREAERLAGLLSGMRSPRPENGGALC